MVFMWQTHFPSMIHSQCPGRSSGRFLRLKTDTFISAGPDKRGLTPTGPARPVQGDEKLGRPTRKKNERCSYPACAFLILTINVSSTTLLFISNKIMFPRLLTLHYRTRTTLIANRPDLLGLQFMGGVHFCCRHCRALSRTAPVLSGRADSWRQLQTLLN